MSDMLDVNLNGITLKPLASLILRNELAEEMAKRQALDAQLSTAHTELRDCLVQSSKIIVEATKLEQKLLAEQKAHNETKHELQLLRTAFAQLSLQRQQLMMNKRFLSLLGNENYEGENVSEKRIDQS